MKAQGSVVQADSKRVQDACAPEEQCVGVACLRCEGVQTAADVQGCSCQQGCTRVVAQLGERPETVGQGHPIKGLCCSSESMALGMQAWRMLALACATAGQLEAMG